MALDPSIALGVRPLQFPDPLAQMAQVSQIQASQRQNEMAQIQLEQLKQDRLEMKDFQSQLEKSGGNHDLDMLAKTMQFRDKTLERSVRGVVTRGAAGGLRRLPPAGGGAAAAPRETTDGPRTDAPRKRRRRRGRRPRGSLVAAREVVRGMGGGGWGV